VTEASVSGPGHPAMLECEPHRELELATAALAEEWRNISELHGQNYSRMRNSEALREGVEAFPPGASRILAASERRPVKISCARAGVLRACAAIAPADR